VTALAVLTVPYVLLGTAQADSDRTETPVASGSPITSVAESVVSVRAPLPDSAGPHPAACDRLSYLRWRAAGDHSADRILIAQPGIFEGAGAFDSVARNTVAAGLEQGRYVEFWAISRRSNCLVDRTGEQAALKAGDPHVALNYYYNGAEVDGRTFSGYVDSAQARWLGHVGVAQTVQDEYDLITHELPSAADRRTRLYCGGHSLGGILTGFFADWDFAGQPGYDQCAGWFALDSVVAPRAPGLTDQIVPTGVVPTGSTASQVSAGLADGTLPSILALPVLINPETENLLGIAGLYARLHPDAVSDLNRIVPHDFNIDTTLRLLFSQDYAHFLTGTPDPRDFTLTGNAALGALMDNNSEPLAFLQASFGFFSGRGVKAKDFPVPNALTGSLSFLGNLFGTDPKAVPTLVGPKYGWLDASQVPTNAYTSRVREVTDTAEMARSFADAPLDFTEWYFPTKLVTDLYLPGDDISSHLIYPDGVAQRPTLQVKAGSGISFGGSTPPNTTLVVAPYYHHLDVLTASPNQPSGEPEIVSTNLLRFVSER
jgi:hypothetical protein